MEWTTIKNIAESIKTGKTPPTKETKYFNGNLNWYAPGDLDLGKFLKTSSRTITKLAIDDKKAIIHKKGTLLVGCIGNIGKIGITIDDCSSNQQLTGIYPNDNTDVHYLYYWFRANKKVLDSYSNNAVVPILNNKILGTVKIPLPPLAEQKRIASILDQADQLRQLNQQILAEYDALTKSLFLDMFGDPVSNSMGWEVKRLLELTSKITDGTHQGPKFINDGIPFLLVSNIVDNQMNFNTKKFISEEEYKFFTKSTPIEVGDILYTSVGSYGNPAIVKSDKVFCFQRHIAHIKPKHNLINVVFLHAMMASPLVKRQADRFALGVAQKTLNLKVIKAFKVFSPPIELQNKFAEKIKNIEAQKASAKTALAASEDLFNSLLQKAFKGEL